MKFIKLIINECIKICKKKTTIIFLFLSILGFFISYGVVVLQIKLQSEYNFRSPSPKYSQEFLNNYKEEYKNASDDRKKELKVRIEMYEFAFENDIYLNDSYISYKNWLMKDLENETMILNSINKNVSMDKYINQKNRIEKIKKIIQNNDFEAYINYKKDNTYEKYQNRLISLDEYNKEIQNLNDNLKYELKKYKENSISWKNILLNRNLYIDFLIIDKYDIQKKEYLNENKIEKLKNEKKINLYRLENNIQTLSMDVNSDTPISSYYSENTNSHYRFQYNSFTIIISMFVIALLFIILASSTISDEISKGTIKFLLVTPTKRYKIILAKILALIIILFIITFVISQISILLGNVFFNNAPNEYLYVQDNVVKVMSTNIYETLQFLLKIPEIFIYILFAMTLSTLLKNKIISNTITLGIYIISNFMIFVTTITSDGIFDSLMKLNFVKYLPITNFNLVDKILPIYKVYDGSIPIEFTNNSLSFSLIIIIVTAILLFITMLESFNKKDM